MADAHNMVSAPSIGLAFPRGGIASIVAILLTVSSLPSLADTSQQGMLNMLFLPRAMKHPKVLPRSRTSKTTLAKHCLH
ncbi:hypothetical protein [Zhongshania sp.]|uniref:hypothetical protein n=1 Tax=Zhongshania sp. TaxID=1971902 RepID=UPI0035692A52